MPITLALLEAELQERREEGCPVALLEREIQAADPSDSARLEALYRGLEELQPEPSLAAAEPSELELIRVLRPAGPAFAARAFSEDVLLDRILGAWLGRVAGCLLGKPCEGWPAQRIRSYLERAGEYPLSGYFPLVLPELVEEGFVGQGRLAWFRGRICGGARDDDTDYTVLGLHILEEHGPAFRTEDVGQEWLSHLPYLQVYTAERVAYANLVAGLEPPQTALWRNPYREWIGAQIRADIYGYVCPGRPEEAAELAYRDARLSHVKNGIYGAMWAAATIAAAFVVRSPLEAVEAGLCQIPAGSRLAQALRDVISWAQADASWEETLARVQAAYGGYHPVHTINNACAVALALLHGGGDFARTVTTAVMCGWDTDCNGATAGSILGAMVGARALPREWVEPLGDRLESAVHGFANLRISQLAERTLAQARLCLREGPA
jgi:ADP-ribosylglycohydrolase